MHLKEKFLAFLSMEKQEAKGYPQYPGLSALTVLPEHKLVTFTDKNGGIRIEIENRDGYLVDATLRKPISTDFQSNADKQLQSEGQLIVGGDITITAQGRQINLLGEFQKAYPNFKPATIALEASSVHLQQPLYTNDIFARSLFYASRGELNPRGNTASHKESNSVRLDIFPSTDLSLLFLIHELIELIQELPEDNVKLIEAKRRSNESYLAAKQHLVMTNKIAESEKGLALVKRIAEMVEQEKSEKLNSVLIDCAADYYWYMAVQQMLLSDKEKSVNDQAFAFMAATIPGLKDDQYRLARVKKMAAILCRWYDFQVGFWQKKLSPISSEHDQEFEAFFAGRNYEFPEQEMDKTLQTWQQTVRSSTLSSS